MALLETAGEVLRCGIILFWVRPPRRSVVLWFGHSAFYVIEAWDGGSVLMEIFRWIALVILVLFTGYSIYCVYKESFFKFFRNLLSSRFGRQATMDLYIGVLLFTFFVYLIEGSVAVALLWLLPAIPFVNIVTLAYFVINFDKIISHFN